MLETVISLILAANSSGLSCGEQFHPAAAQDQALSALSPAHWNADKMVEGMKSLGLPVVTISLENQHEPYLPEKYPPQAAWEPFFQLTRVMCGQGSPCEKLISLLMLPSLFPEITQSEHRGAMGRWVNKYLPGYRLSWPEDLIKLGQELKGRFPNLEITAPTINDVGAIHEALYHRAIGEKIIPLMNHHDLLGHLLAFSIPGNAELTRRFSGIFADLYELARRRALADELPTVNFGMRPHLLARTDYEIVRWNLINTWNFIQERRILLSPCEGQAKAGFGIIGGLSTLCSYLYDLDSDRASRAISEAFLPYFNRRVTKNFTDSLAEGPPIDPGKFPRLHQLQLNLDTAVARARKTEAEIGTHLDVDSRNLAQPLARELRIYTGLLNEYLFDPKSPRARQMPLSARVDYIAAKLSKFPRIVSWMNRENYLIFWSAYLDVLEAWMKKETYILDQTMPRLVR